MTSPNILAKNSDLAVLAQLLLAGAATPDMLAAAKLEDVRAIKSDTGAMHYRSTTFGRIGETNKAGSDIEQRTYRFVASEESADRMGDIIRVGGWNLAPFKSNPIGLWNHDPGCPISTVGDMQKATGERPPRLYESMTFPKAGSSPDSDVARALVDEGVIKAVSVGFLPELVTWPESDEERTLLGVGRFGCIYEKQEQLELSLCSIPCHPSALITGKALMSERMKVAGALGRMVGAGKLDKALAEAFLERCGASVRKLFPVKHVVVRTVEVEKAAPVVELATIEAPPFKADDATQLVLETLLRRVDAQDARIAELGKQLRDERATRAQVSRTHSPADFYGAAEDMSDAQALQLVLAGGSAD